MHIIYCFWLLPLAPANNVMSSEMSAHQFSAFQHLYKLICMHTSWTRFYTLNFLLQTIHIDPATEPYVQSIAVCDFLLRIYASICRLYPNIYWRRCRQEWFHRSCKQNIFFFLCLLIFHIYVYYIFIINQTHSCDAGGVFFFFCCVSNCWGIEYTCNIHKRILLYTILVVNIHLGIVFDCLLTFSDGVCGWCGLCLCNISCKYIFLDHTYKKTRNPWVQHVHKSHCVRI